MVATARVSPVATPRPWSTLRLLKAARFIILALNLLLLLAIVSATETHHAALKAIDKDATPSIVAAQHMQAAMSNMDADVAEELLVPSNMLPALVQAYDNRREETAGALIAAAEDIKLGDAERLPVQSLQLGLGSYERQVQRARDLRQTDGRGALAAYREAAGTMDNVLLPAGEALRRANDEALERTYRREGLRFSAARIAIVVLALATLIALVAAQMMLSRRMHRTLNPLLIAATLTVAALALGTLHVLTGAQDSLRLAKQHAFTSVDALWHARARAAAARANECRFLLDPGDAAEHQRNFEADAGALALWPADLDVEQLEAALREGRPVEGFSGLLATEVGNTSSAAEQNAALETLTDWQHYLIVDTRLHQLERAGQQRQAVELGTGSHAGQSAWAFQQFDDALGRTLVMSRASLRRDTGQSASSIHGLELEAGLAVLAISLAVLAGFAPRVREYR